MTAFAVVNVPHVHLTLENKSHILNYTGRRLQSICAQFMAFHDRAIAHEYQREVFRVIGNIRRLVWESRQFLRYKCKVWLQICCCRYREEQDLVREDLLYRTSFEFNVFEYVYPSTVDCAGDPTSDVMRASTKRIRTSHQQSKAEQS